MPSNSPWPGLAEVRWRAETALAEVTRRTRHDGNDPDALGYSSEPFGRKHLLIYRLLGQQS
jgi:hypothetical protein